MYEGGGNIFEKINSVIAEFLKTGQWGSMEFCPNIIWSEYEHKDYKTDVTLEYKVVEDTFVFTWRAEGIKISKDEEIIWNDFFESLYEEFPDNPLISFTCSEVEFVFSFKNEENIPSEKKVEYVEECILFATYICEEYHTILEEINSNAPTEKLKKKLKWAIYLMCVETEGEA